MCFNWLLASVIKLQMKFVKLSLITYKFPGSLRRKNTYDNVNVSLSKDVNCGCRKRWTEFMNWWLQHINFRLPISYLKSETMALRRHERIFSKRGTRFTSSLDNFSWWKKFLYSFRTLFLLIKRSRGRDKFAFCLFRFLRCKLECVLDWQRFNCPYPFSLCSCLIVCLSERDWIFTDIIRGERKTRDLL